MCEPGWVDGLQELPLVFQDAGAGEAADLGVSPKAAVDNRGAAAVETADEHQPASDPCRTTALHANIH
jgi:hypothetical protein